MKRDIPINTRVVVRDPRDRLPYHATYLGCICDEHDNDVAIIRPDGWTRKLIALHPSCLTETA